MKILLLRSTYSELLSSLSSFSEYFCLHKGAYRVHKGVLIPETRGAELHELYFALFMHRVVCLFWGGPIRALR